VPRRLQGCLHGSGGPLRVSSEVAILGRIRCPAHVLASPPVNAFLVATGVVALAEIGDKTQIATVALAARYDALIAVVAGTALGMMIANVPAVLLGEIAAKKMPQRFVHGIAAVLFAAMGIVALVGARIAW
jgi:Ca2+/H+ antiporter, TMEM165/GDT1 family